MKDVVFIIMIGLFLTGCTAETEQQEEVSKTSEAPKSDQLNQQAIDEDFVTEQVVVDEVDRTMDVQEVEYEYVINETNWRVEPINEANEKVVLLTIDDAAEHYAVEMGSILKELDVSAIFFVNGHFIQGGEGRSKLKKIDAMGFEIGNHTMSHQNLSKLTDEEQRREIVDLSDLIEDITGERPRFFRAPFGVNTDTSKQVVEEEGMQWMNWSYGYDYFQDYMEKEALTEIMIHAPELTDGANLLMHDRKWTKEALTDIVTGLQEKGYDIVDPASIK